jgi:hypothetical protein
MKQRVNGGATGAGQTAEADHHLLVLVRALASAAAREHLDNAGKYNGVEQ